MKVALIVRKLSVTGGTQRQALSLAQELTKRGHAITLYTLHYDRERCYPELLEGMNVVVEEMPRGGGLVRAVGSFLGNLWRENESARRLARKIALDTELLNPHDQLSYKVAYYFKRRHPRVPSVWNMNDVPSLVWGYDRLREVSEAPFHQPGWKRILYHLFDAYDNRKYIRPQDRIVAVDDFNRRIARKYLDQDAIVVRNGPDLDHFIFRARAAPPGHRVKLLTSGILMPHRRFQDAIRAVAILAGAGYDPHLTIIGDYRNDPRYHALLTRIVTELGLEARVTFRGKISERELIQAYDAHDVYLWQHHLQSNGLSPFEAAACGMPVLVSRTAGCHEVLTDGENALLIRPKDPADIATRVRALVDDPLLFQRLSAAGNRLVRERFSWSSYTSAMEGVYRQALAGYS